MDLQKFWSDLHSAIEKNDTEFARVTLLNNSEFCNDMCAIDAVVPLFYALKSENIEIFELLINFFESITFDALPATLENYLHTAVASGNLKLTEFFLTKGARFVLPPDEIVKRNSLFDNVFSRNSSKNRTKMLQLLLEHGLEVVFKEGNGVDLANQFIRFHVEENDADAVEIVEIILKCGVYMDGVDNEGYSPLQSAIYSKNMKLISYLIDNGAQVNRSPSRCSPLLAAAECHNEEIFDLLVSRGADINGHNKNGHGALHEACGNLNDEKVFNFLIKKGANLNAKTKDGKTALGLLHSRGNDDLAVVLIKIISIMYFEKIPVSKSDLRLIRGEKKFLRHFTNCTRELRRMRDNKFYSPFTLYRVFKMSNKMKKLVPLTKNEKFVRRFERQLQFFPYYGTDLRRILGEATKARDESKMILSCLHEIFGRIFPDLILEEIEKNLKLGDLICNKNF